MAKKSKNVRKLFLQGNQACAMAAIDAGCKFFGGYPITPSTEIAEILSIELPKVGGTFIQMEDELGSICSCIGASIAGKKSMTSTSGPGFSLMQEGIGYACITETPVVIVNVMRGGPSTGLPTSPSQGDVQQARWGSHGDHEMIVLSASNVEECYYSTIRAFNLSEKYRTPVVLLLDEVVAHMRQNVILPDPKTVKPYERKHPSVPPDWYEPYATKKLIPVLANFGEGYRYHITGLVHDEKGFPTSVTSEIFKFKERLKNKITHNTKDISIVELHNCEKAEIVILSYGCVVLSVMEAIRKAGRKKNIGPDKVGMIKLDTLWPFPDKELNKIIDDISKHAKTIIVAEMNSGQIYREVERVNRGRLKIDSIFQNNGQLISPETVYKKILGALS